MDLLATSSGGQVFYYVIDDGQKNARLPFGKQVDGGETLAQNCVQ